MYQCAKCVQLGCEKQDLDKTLPECPSKNNEVQGLTKKEYGKEENKKISYHSACVEAKGYGQDTRLIEIIKFMNRMAYKKIGLAFCAGFTKEGREVTKILEYNGFEVVSVICKNGAIPKTFVGLEDENTIRGSAEKEVMCNPIGQAKILADCKTDFNLVLGLCVGHDTLFFKYTEAPVTVIAVKDRVTGHNPLAPVYCSEGYYKKKFYPENPDEYKF
ncbi:MAG: DUF1847 domain-containing protein [Tissierellia bacterium]|nr:DUF1847 domain-containing protein [Tissierellia bacterium]